jgi:hypothetical protein
MSAEAENSVGTNGGEFIGGAVRVGGSATVTDAPLQGGVEMRIAGVRAGC